ncbi:MAG: hypothetical protein CVU91_06890 [Firmicutes bacterium HGW-Firmicutes-16]|nr:MAG: hypothetical protein CVU91_06890 [Firmicutes bacterium HGW-Firmicutes-16]
MINDKKHLAIPRIFYTRLHADPTNSDGIRPVKKAITALLDERVRINFDKEVKTMLKLKLRLKAAQIELNWWFIRRERRKGADFLKKGLSHSSPKMLKLNRRFSKHCAMAMKAQSNYERLARLSGLAPIMRV